jgi:hypothetical protein
VQILFLNHIITHTATCKVSAVSRKCLNFYYYNHFKIYPRRTGQAGNFHSYGPVTCNKSANVIILQSGHMYVCNTYLQCFHFFVVVTFPSSKLSNPHNSSFLHPSAFPPCFSAMMGKDKMLVYSKQMCDTQHHYQTSHTSSQMWMKWKSIQYLCAYLILITDLGMHWMATILGSFMIQWRKYS